MKKIREYSIPLIAGVIVAIIFANVAPDLYDKIINTPIVGHKVSLQWFVKDIFMVFFFGIAGVEIVNALSKGGPLNPLKKAATPLLATAGGVLGPIACFFVLNSIIGSPDFANGWGITTATDIALAWLVAKIVFGKNHPAVSFLLLLAVVDDAIGLAIIAIFYPDPHHPTQLQYLGLVVAGMVVAYLFRKFKINSVIVYVLVAGGLAWAGMYNAGLHPSLALIFIVPFMPKAGAVDEHADAHGVSDAHGESTLHRFEEKVSPVVDYGLFFFGFSNAGVEFSQLSNLTWIVLIALIVGKTLGISIFSLISTKVLRFPLPDGMKAKDVVAAGVVAGMGLTVALFVCSAAFVDVNLQGAAKMGALFTVLAAPIAIVVSKLLRIEKRN